MNCRLLLFAAVALTFSAAARAQTVNAPPPAADVVDAPPAPVPPATISRDDRGRATVRAVRLTAPLQIDGKLTEPLYENLPMTGFVQIEPKPGQPAIEKTEMWLSFDRDQIYVSARCWDSDARIVASEMRRDNNAIFQGDDIILFLFDTFHDQRNSVIFNVNPLGARMDGQVVNERQYNGDWNPIWRVTSGRFEGGWTFEAAVPFKSLRYGSGPVWGFNAMRAKRSTNELATLTEVPPGRGQTAVQQASLAATLVGLEFPAQSRPLDLKPYVTSSLNSDIRARPTAISNKPDANVGLDAKYALTDGITGDLTINTDFAQVEADEQQVNLTRFSLFFPEKRDFFLENQGTFSFGGVAVGGMNTGGDAPVLFYSRRIGLNGGRIVPLRAGGRVTGRAGPYTVGALDIQTGDEELSNTRSTNFSVVRLKRDILRRSNIGLIATHRSQSIVIPGASNLVYGADAGFSFFQNVNFGGYWAQSDTDGVKKDKDSYQGRFEYTGDRYGAQAQYMKVGDNFNPEVGFVRRDNMRRSYGLAKFAPRPKERFKGIRQFTYQGTIEYIENGAGQLETRIQTARFAAERQNSDLFSVEANADYELLLRPFTVSPGVVIRRGGYSFNQVTTSYAMGLQRRVSGTWTLQAGQFYDGTITALGFTAARVSLLKQWSVEPSVSYNDVNLPAGDFTTTVVRARSDYGFSPRMFASALLQYSSTDHVFSSNLRYRWEYLPGSELFVVYTDERDTLQPGYPDLKNRAFVVKVNRLFRF